MGVQSEAVYLLNDEKYLHLRENTSGVGYATYDKLTLLPLERGRFPLSICRPMAEMPFLPPGTGSFLSCPTTLARPSSWKA